jgi:chromosome segregation ATPase
MISNFLTQVKLDVETGKLRQEVLVLQERNGILQRSVDECRRQLENQQESSMVTRNEYEKKLKDERDSSHTHIQALQGRILQGDLQKTQAIREAEGLRNSLAAAQGDLLVSREQAQNVQASRSAWDAQVKELTTQNHALQAEKVGLLERNHNISTRYETNELVSCRTFAMTQMFNSNGGRASKRRPL